MTLTFAAAAQLSIAINGGVLALGLVLLGFLGRRVNPALPVMFVVFALQMIGEFAHQTQSNVALSELRAALSLTYGPLLYFYFLGFVEKGRAFRPADALHAIPFAVAAATLAAPFYGLYEIGIHWYALAAGVSVLAYAALIWRAVRPRVAPQTPARRVRWLIAAGGLSALMLALTAVATNFNCEIIASAPIRATRDALLVSIFLTMNAFVFGGLWDPEVIFGAPRKNGAAEAAEDAHILKGLSKLFDEQVAHRDSSLTLERLAERLNVRPRRLSSAVNRRHGASVPTLINRRRVDEAKRLLANPAHANTPLLEIADAAGFNSKATFNRVFKDLEGETPSAYRARAAAGQKGA